MRDRWKHLLRFLRPERPPEDMSLYVRPPRSSADSICAAFDADPTSFQKFLLVGARGGGKSTELRAVAQHLEDKATLATIDLDASGVSPSSLSAFDLLYLSGLALLRLLADAHKQTLYAKLTQAYGGNDAQQLGSWNEALQGLEEFASAASKVGDALGVTTILPGVSAAMGAVRQGLRLLSRRDGFVAETSPQGRALQAACAEIARNVRELPDNRGPLCVLIDGLEKMNGEANSRFEHIFCQTRLLADTEWMTAIAAPPSTLTKTNAAHSMGYKVLPVYGFDSTNEGELEILINLLNRRFVIANLNPQQHVAEGQLGLIARMSGGLPRHAIQIAQAAVQHALQDDASRIEASHVEEGLRGEAETLGLGLTEEDLHVMAGVHRKNQLPGDERAAKLFADGRILAHPPVGRSSLPRFVVHPLLRDDVAGLADQANDGEP